ncbi:MAG: hypothetical protein ABIN74_08220 [Ferruginibacter sp.]
MNAQRNFSDQQQADAVMSFLLLRKLIGILGILLPFVLAIGTYFLGNCNELQPSLSHYYYSITHIVFVGTLCVLGSFLITYRGTSKYKYENAVSNFAGVCSFGVAVFPTNMEGLANPEGRGCQFIALKPALMGPEYTGYVHYAFAALLFICFVIFCLKIFQDADLGEPIDGKKVRRNKIYKLCGYIIIASIVGIAAVFTYNGITGRDNFPYSTILFETTALLPFGFSWLLKGSVNLVRSKNVVVKKTVQYFR